MPRIALSPEVIASLPIPERGKSKARVIYWDETLPRFGVEVHDSGKKIFLGLVKMGRGVEKRVMLGNAEYVAYGAAKAQALRIFEENDAPSSEDGQFETTAGRFWIAEQDGLLYPWGVFWTHPTLGQWHQKVAAFRDRGRAEQYVLAETSALVDEFAAPDLVDLPPMDNAPVSRVVIRREPSPKLSNHVSFSGRRWKYQRAVPARLQRLLGGKKMISRGISIKLSRAEVMAVGDRYTQEDEDLFRRLHAELDAERSKQGQAPLVELEPPAAVRPAMLVPTKSKAQPIPSRKYAAAVELCSRIMTALPSLHGRHPNGGVPTKVLADALNISTTTQWNALRHVLNRMHEEGQIQWVYINAGGYGSKYVFAAGAPVPRPHLTAAQQRALAWLRAQPSPIRTSHVEIAKSANVTGAYKVVSNLAKSGYIDVEPSEEDGSLMIVVNGGSAASSTEMTEEALQ